MMTDAFASAWSQVATRQPVALVRIVTTGATVYVATAPIMVNKWQFDPLLVGGGTITNRGAFLGSSVTLPSASFTIADGPSSVAGGDRFSTLLAAYQFVGAKVTVWLWERSLTNFADAPQRFTGVVQSYKVGGSGVAFTCLADRSFNRSITPTTVTREKYPQAPDSSVGNPPSTYYGHVQPPPMRYPWPAEYGLPQRARELVSGGRRTGRAVLVDTGIGANAAKVVVAGHPCYQIGNLSSTGYPGGGVFVESGGKTVALEIPSGDFFNNATDGAGFTIADSSAAGRYPFWPTKWTGNSTKTSTGLFYGPPLHLNALLDPDSEYSFVTVGGISADTYSSTITGTFSGGSGNGTITKLTLYVGLRARASAITGLSWKMNLGVGTQFATAAFTDLSPADKSVPWVHSFDITIAGSVPDTLAKMSGCTLTINSGYPTSTDTLADIYFAGVTAWYIPDQDIVDSNTHVLVTPMPMPFNNPFPAGTSEAVVNTYRDKQLTTNTYEVIGKFTANVSGWADDSSGHFTGTPNALIERVPDVIFHILANYGGLTYAVGAGKIVTGVAWGSFTEARALFQTFSGRDMVLGFSFAQEMQISSLLSWLMAASASEVWVSAADGRWRIAPWKAAPEVVYPKALGRGDVLDPERGVSLELMPDSDVLSAVVINYGRDESTGSYMHTINASATNSCSGHLYHSMRDGGFTVTAGVNDAIDAYTTIYGGIQATAYIAPGAYTQQTMTTQLARLFATPETTFTVIVGVNDRVDWSKDGGAVTFSIMAPGTYTRASWVSALRGWMSVQMAGGCLDTPLGLKFARIGAFVFRWDLNPTINARALFGFSKAESISVPLGSVCGWSVGATATTDPVTLFASPTVNSVGFNGVVAAGQNGVIPIAFDQQLVTLNVNDSVVVQTTAGGATATATLTAGWYTPTELAAEAQRAIRVVLANTNVVFNLTAGANGHRVFSWQNAAGMALLWANTTNSAEALFGWQHVSSGFVTTLFYSSYTIEAAVGQNVVTMTPGTYTMAGLAAEAQRAIRAAAFTGAASWTVTFDATARTYTFTGPTGYAPWLRWNWPKTAAALFGFASRAYFGTGSGPWTFTGVACGAEGQLAITTTADVQRTFQWYTGTHGLTGTKTSAATTLGFDWQNDDEGGEYVTTKMWGTTVNTTTRVRHLAVVPKSAVEVTLAAADAAYGKKVPVQIDGRCINDTRTALELRDRLVAMATGPRGIASFSSETLPDMERGHTFQFSSDMDLHRAYCVGGTDGSWTGKTFRVIEEEHRFGDAWQSDFVAVDVTS